jgi:hypothetical protein
MTWLAWGLGRFGRPVDPSGVVTATRTRAVIATAPIASASCRPLNGPTRPRRSGR